MRKTKLKFGGGTEGSLKGFESNISKKFDEIEQLLEELTKTKDIKDIEKNAGKDTERQSEKERGFTDSKFPQLIRNKK